MVKANWHGGYNAYSETRYRHAGKGDGLRDSVANEHICMRICAALGLSVAKTQILTFED